MKPLSQIGWAYDYNLIIPLYLSQIVFLLWKNKFPVENKNNKTKLILKLWAIKP